MENIRPAAEEETAYLNWRAPSSGQETPPLRDSKFKKPWEEKILPVLLAGDVARIVLEEEEYHSAANGLRGFVHKNTLYRIQTRTIFRPAPEEDPYVLYVKLLEE